MSDGTQLRQTWYHALNEAEAHFRRLLTSPSSAEWRRVSIADSNSTKGKSRALLSSSTPELGDVIVHRSSGKSGDGTWRAVLDVPVPGDGAVSLDAWRGVLVTPELRKEWDSAVESANIVELFDHATRISKTNFTLGWPAYPRDAVVISRTFNDNLTVIDISTSLPRSSDEPPYLHPSPPYVRSFVKLFAWCIQYVQPPPPSPPRKSNKDTTPVARKASGGSTPARIRITCFWHHDLRAAWTFAPSQSALAAQLAGMVLGLQRVVQKRGARVPVLTGYGNGVSIERIKFEIDRESLTVDYAIVHDDSDGSHITGESLKGFDELHAMREARRLARSIECELPSADGWDVQVSTKAPRPQVAQLPWQALAQYNTHTLPSPVSTSPTGLKPPQDPITFTISHAPLPDAHSILKVRAAFERSGSSGLRLNGLAHALTEVSARDPSAQQASPHFMSKSMLQDAASTAEISFKTATSAATSNSGASTVSMGKAGNPVLQGPMERTPAAEKSISSRVKRNYIYFSSLLQEPDAKWKRTTEARGVEVTQLDSIDPTLVVYRAEATFVGINIWDLYAAIVSPGARVYWDRLHEDATLLEDVSELSDLWHLRTKPAWPVVGRDVVVLTTAYKSASAIHVFSFSADDVHLFPSIPPVGQGVIRTQVDLYGWSIEALSPTTTLVTLLEQSDPKGWTNKTSIPQQMIATLAGVGEFTIKCGGPPVVTRLAGARVTQTRYDHERALFRVEYEAAASRRGAATQADGGGPKDESSVTNADGAASSSIGHIPVIELELRCDVDTWSPSLDIVIDPPPQNVSCLRRHRLSTAGGGLWLTITHDAVYARDERVLVLVRKGPSREKGLVMVNGARAMVDGEDLPEAEVKALARQKRTKPVRIPLDQPPVIGVIRRRRQENGEGEPSSPEASPPLQGLSLARGFLGSPRISSPLANFFTMAVQSTTSATQQAVAAIVPVTMNEADTPLPSAPDVGTSFPTSASPAMQYALDALGFVKDYYARLPAGADEWTLLSDKGFPVHRNLCPTISSNIPVHRGEKVIECVSAEEVATVLTTYGCRRQWDDRFDSAHVLQEYGAGCHTAFVVTKGGFPFRDRGFYLASVMARTTATQTQIPRRSLDNEDSGALLGSSSGSERRSAVLCVSASFSPDSVLGFKQTAYNPYALPIGRMLIDAWILETLDPYATENFAIPSTRCTRLVAVDYAGAIPAAVNSMINAALPRTILSVETYIKSLAAFPITRLPAAGVMLSDRKNEEGAKSAWTLRRRDNTRQLVTTSYTSDTRTYRTLVAITMAMSTRSLKADDVTPRPTRLPASLRRDESRPRPRRQDSAPSAPSSPQSSGPMSPTLFESSTQRERSGSRSARSISTLTIRGDLRPAPDLLVGELVVDSKLYPHGCRVSVSSFFQDSKAKYVPLGKTPAQVHLPDAPRLLPLVCTAYTLPSTPLHSSGLSADRPTRHLLRLTLPTAQYQWPTIQDPLTGETRAAPPKPQWLTDLQDGLVAMVDLVVDPLEPQPSQGVKAPMAILFNGEKVGVATESEALTTLGRDELTDERVGRMTMLTRVDPDAGTFPAELEVPLGVSDHLLDPSSSLLAPTKDITPLVESNPLLPGHKDSLPTTPIGTPDSQPETSAPAATSLLGFFNSYPNPLARLSVLSQLASKRASTDAPRRPSVQAIPERKEDATPPELTPAPDPAHTTTATTIETPSYPLRVLIAVALIAFLAGSLLRSLLSPADFIYVATDLKDTNEQSGWREIKRLLEVKYIVGGWDFQIAVVRRH